MGCFTMFRGKKKKSAQVLRKCNTFKETMPTKLPEPEDHASSLQSAPPSFRTGTKSVQLSRGMASGRVRALSAPSSLHVPDGDPTTSAAEPEKEEEFKSDNLVGKDQRVNPQPLPLPSPQDTSDLKHTGNFKSSALNGLSSSGTLPLPPSTSGGLRNFSYDEIAAACLQFSKDRRTSEGLSSMVYTASFGDNSSIKKIEATVSCIHHSNQGFKDFINELNLLASLHHPHLCKLLGFHAREGSHHRMLVFEKLYHGSLDRLLCGRSDGPLIDWGARMKVALCTAQGLAFLHEEGPFQAMYNEFSAANVQIDKDFSAKLSGYGCVSSNPEGEIPNTSAAANLSLETLEKGLLTPKSNVWSFGIFLLELLTGRRNLDPRHSREEGNLVKWSKPFLSDDCRLSLIVDSRLKGRFPPKAARTVADIALKCLQKEPSERPTMRAVVESLGNIQDMRHSNRFPPSRACPRQKTDAKIPKPQRSRHPSCTKAAFFSLAAIGKLAIRFDIAAKAVIFLNPPSKKLWYYNFTRRYPDEWPLEEAYITISGQGKRRRVLIVNIILPFTQIKQPASENSVLSGILIKCHKL